ncbi:MAG TPA: hypothetical protein VNX02_11545 [Steroidobacteraceae bacterium]|jgi:hypothetical protein|nr:hypothetical protein [Steroidobacteraceae bacterium]
MPELVQVDLRRCDQIATVLRAFPLPPSQEDFRLPNLDEDSACNLVLCLVAICHQTQDLRGSVSGVALRGWDYLSAKLTAAVQVNRFPLHPSGWSAMSAEDVALLFSCDEHGETLSDPRGRAALLQDLGSVMIANGWGSLREPYNRSGHRAVSGDQPLLEALQEFRAYRDPVRKKSLYLIALLKSCCGWTFSDEDRLPSPVDYHEVRGHLRIGTVKIVSQDLLEKLRGNRSVTDDEDVAIRSCVQRAIAQIAQSIGGVQPTTLHYLLWNLFRNVCLRQGPQCERVSALGTLPERYEYLTKLHGGTPACPFRQVCSAHASHVYAIEHNNPSTIWY